MGLDSVELVMAVEEHFDISIPDREAAGLITVGMLHSWVVAELRRIKRSDVNAENVFADLRGLICKQLGVRPEQVVSDARFVDDLGMD
jgi:acyl carrier protein